MPRGYLKETGLPIRLGKSWGKHTEETKKRIGEHSAKIFLGKKLPLETRLKMSKNRRGKMCGEKHWNWKKDRNLLKARDERNDPAYHCWSADVKRRDNWKCKINNNDCKGRLEAHHILPWRQYPELRYEIKNGITLCQFHHPRERDAEQRLIPMFQMLVEVIRT